MVHQATEVKGTDGLWPNQAAQNPGTVATSRMARRAAAEANVSLAPAAHPNAANQAGTGRSAKNARGLQFWLGIGLLVAGLAIGARWLWGTFGTTMAVQETQAAAIAEFTELLPVTGDDVIVEPELLFTDFELNPPPVLDVHSIPVGEMFGLLTIPSWNELRGAQDELLRNRIMVKQGGFSEAETNRVLNTGAAAHYIETAGPGEVGNFSLSAHRRSYGDNFLHLPELVAGDYVLLETKVAWYIYRVIGHDIVLPTDTSVINPDPFSPVNADGTQVPTRRLLTLTTCTGANGSPWRNTHRWIVHAELEAWMPRENGLPPMIDHYWQEDATVLAASAPTS